MISGKNTLTHISTVTRYFSFCHAFQMLNKFDDWIGNQKPSLWGHKTFYETFSIINKKCRLTLDGYIIKYPASILNSKLLKYQYVGQYAIEMIGKLIHLGYYVTTSFLGETLPSKEQWVFQLLSYIILTINTTDCLKFQNSLPDLELHLASFGKLIMLFFFPPYYKQTSKLYIKYSLY